MTTELATAVREVLADVRVDRSTATVAIGNRAITVAAPGPARRELASVIYQRWHSGNDRDPAASDGLRRDRELERALIAAVPHRTSRTPAALVSIADGYATAEVGRVRVRVPADLVPPPTGHTGGPVSLPLPAVRPCLSPGFLMVHGEAGASTKDGSTLRLYAHLAAADAAPRVLGAALRTLERDALRYSAKVVSRSVSFPRRDALVVYLAGDAIRVVPELARALAGLPGIADETPLMCHRMEPGISLAWEPGDARPGWDAMSFGQHRATAVADGMVRHLSAGQPLDEAVCAALRDASVDPARPSRNLTSPALPMVAVGHRGPEDGR